MPQGHPGQLLCWDRGLHHLCSKRGKRAYALSQCTQQGEAHPIYLVTCSLFWVVGGKWFSLDGAAETDRQAKRFGFHSSTLRSPEWRDNWLSSSLMLLGEAMALQSWKKLYSQAWVTLVFVFVLHKVLIFLTPQAEQFVIGDKKEVRYFWYDMQETGWGLHPSNVLLSCLLPQIRGYPHLTHDLDFWLWSQAWFPSPSLCILCRGTGWVHLRAVT